MPDDIIYKILPPDDTTQENTFTWAEILEVFNQYRQTTFDELIQNNAFVRTIITNDDLLFYILTQCVRSYRLSELINKIYEQHHNIRQCLDVLTTNTYLNIRSFLNHLDSNICCDVFDMLYEDHPELFANISALIGCDDEMFVLHILDQLGPEYFNSYPYIIHKACKYHHVMVVAKLLQWGHDPNIRKYKVRGDIIKSNNALDCLIKSNIEHPDSFRALLYILKNKCKMTSRTYDLIQNLDGYYGQIVFDCFKSDLKDYELAFLIDKIK